jgi:hypothetical protein
MVRGKIGLGTRVARVVIPEVWPGPSLGPSRVRQNLPPANAIRESDGAGQATHRRVGYLRTPRQEQAAVTACTTNAAATPIVTRSRVASRLR